MFLYILIIIVKFIKEFDLKLIAKNIRGGDSMEEVKEIVVLERGSSGFDEPNFCGVFCNPVKN